MDLPDAMSFEEGASIACGTGTAYAAVKKLGVSGADTFAVFGQGPVGLSATLIGSALGARVIAIDVVPYRLELAKRLGAAEVFNANDGDSVEAVKGLTKGEGTEATMDCTGLAAIRAQAVDSAKVFGRMCFVGEGGEVTLDGSRQIIHKYLSIYGSWTFTTWMLEEAANWFLDRNVPLKDLVTHRFSIEQAHEAYELFQSGQTGKVVFVWD
jgi:threonine dehydrogenase-like Zn-dependent dehydrogenase